MKIAVAGGSGQLSRALQHLRPGLTVWPSSRVDIRSAEAVRGAMEADRPEVVINAAAWVDVDGAETKQEEAYALNQYGAANLAAACGAAGARLVQVSTDYVFDGKKEGAYVEGDATNPLGAYGDSKLWGEREVQSRCADHVIVRTAWLYGPWAKRSFVDTMLKLTAERESVDVVDDQWGSPTMTLDLGAAILWLAERSDRGIFHVVNAGKTTWHGLTEKIVELTKRKCRVNRVSRAVFARPAKRPDHSILDTTRLREAGYTLRGWDEALADYLAHWTGQSPR